MTSRSSMLSAPAAIPAMIEVSFGVGFAAPDLTLRWPLKAALLTHPWVGWCDQVLVDGGDLLGRAVGDRAVVLARWQGVAVATERSEACPLLAGEVRGTPSGWPAGKISC